MARIEAPSRRWRRRRGDRSDRAAATEQPRAATAEGRIAHRADGHTTPQRCRNDTITTLRYMIPAGLLTNIRLQPAPDPTGGRAA